MIEPVVGPERRAEFLSLSAAYLVWHLADLSRHIGRAIDAEPFLASEPAWLDGLLAGGRAWLAADESGPTGVVALDLRGAVPELKRLYVAERARGRRLGRRLAECAVAAA